MTKLALKQYQLEGIKFLKNNGTRTPYWSILADEVGLGKTAQVLIAAKELGAKSIWVATTKSGIKSAWLGNIKTWYPELRVRIFETNSKTGQKPDLTYKYIDEPTIFIGTYQAWTAAFKSYTRPGLKPGHVADIVVVDEAHYIKDHKNTRTKTFLNRYGVCDRAKYRWFLTATPILNRPMELYPILASHFAWVIDHMSRFDYASKYCGLTKGDFGYKETGCTNVDDLALRLQHIMLRRTRKGLGSQGEDDAPLVSLVYVEPDDYLNNLIKEEYRQLIDWFNKNTTDYVDSANLLHEIEDRIKNKGVNIPMVAARRLQSLALIPDYIGIIEAELATTDKLFVVAWHRDVIAKLHHVFGFTSTNVFGGSTNNVRAKAISDFVNKPDVKILFASIDCVREAIDGLQYVCHKILFLELHWSPKVNEQAIGRLLRYGQDKRVLVDVVLVKGSISERVYYATKNKEDAINNIIKGKHEMSQNDKLTLAAQRLADNIKEMIEIIVTEKAPAIVNKEIKGAISVAQNPVNQALAAPVGTSTRKTTKTPVLPGTAPAAPVSEGVVLPGTAPAAPAPLPSASAPLPSASAPAAPAAPLPSASAPLPAPAAPLPAPVAQVNKLADEYGETIKTLKEKVEPGLFTSVLKWVCDSYLRPSGVQTIAELPAETIMAVTKTIKDTYGV